MTEAEPTEIPKGSYAAGRRVPLPRDAQPPFAVYVNGIEQREGSDYAVRAGEIVFSRQIVKEKVGAGRWLAMYLGLFGTYRKNETIDLQFQRGGRTELLSDHSEAVNGKLYMTGGGWNVLRLPELPHEWGFHIALGLDVGWDETNAHHDLLVSVHDPDGAELGEGLSAEFEAGRPPGRPAGQEQRLVMSIGTAATFTTAGPHAAVVQANGEEIGRARFYVTAGEPNGQELGSA